MKNTLMIVLISLLVLLFMYTGISKFRNFHNFNIDLAAQPFPKSWLPFISVAVPSIEILTSIGLLFSQTRLPALFASLALMLFFTVYGILVLMHFFNKVPCSCGGVIRNLSWQQHLVFNLFFLAVSATAIKLCMHKNRTNRKPG